jgi:ATP-binding cassette subfamily F protein 3
MLVIDDLSVRVAGRLLLERASAQIPAGARVGLVGRNGVGKTTLFRALTGEIATESGAINLPKRSRVGRLAQEAPDGPESLLDVVLAADVERTALIAAAEREGDPGRIAEIQTRLADIAAHSAPARAAAILSGLGFSEQDTARACSDFSGGWRMRVALAAVLFSEPDLLLLDEPTNYLDLEGTLWLQTHLARYPRTVIVISHDRDLLDSAVDWILHLDAGKLALYRGGYSSFERQRRERLELDAKLAKKQETKRRHMQAFVDRFRAKASKARQAQSRLKMLAKLEPAPALVTAEVLPIKIPAPARALSPPIIALDDVAVGYRPGAPVLRRLSLRIDSDDRIALLGANGNGKSTLLKLLAGRIELMQGRMTQADKLKVGYFAQHQLDELNASESGYDHLRRLMPTASEATVRSHIGAVGFPGDLADTPTAQLSGGEKARLVLALAAFAGPHLMILDEPANHLDIDSRAALIEAINAFPGAVILVSHDGHLLDACAERLWLVDAGTVTPFSGDLDDYRKLILNRASAHSPAAADATADRRGSRLAQRRAAARKRAELAPLLQRIAAAETKVAQLAAEVARLDAALSAVGLFARDPAKAAVLAKARADASDALAAAEAEWLEASSAYEVEGAGETREAFKS